jgi:hypothetical protein
VGQVIASLCRARLHPNTECSLKKSDDVFIVCDPGLSEKSAHFRFQVCQVQGQEHGGEVTSPPKHKVFSQS